MTEPATPTDGTPPAAQPAATLPPGGAGAGAGASAAPPPAQLAQVTRHWLTWVNLVLVVLSLAWVYQLSQRLRLTEEEFARRDQQSLQQIVEARTLSRQAEVTTRDMAAKLALVEARVGESALQRTQLEELMQSMSRSRDENVLFDIDAALRVAQQQSALTGSVEPLVAALKQTEERLALARQPRLERVRRAALEDLDRVRAAGSVDLTTLTLKLDEVTRQVEDLPLVSAHGATSRQARVVEPAKKAGQQGKPSGEAAASPSWLDTGRDLLSVFWREARELVKVTRIESPEAALLAPEQAIFLRENLRLRLLSARLSLLSRQFDAAQGDMRQAQALIDKYFDRSSRRVVAASDLLKQVTAQSRAVIVPRPTSTLSALAAVTGGR